MNLSRKFLSLILISAVLTSCQAKKLPEARLLFLTGPTHAVFSQSEDQASYDVMVANLASGKQIKTGQVVGTACMEWSDKNRLYLRVINHQIQLLDQNLNPVSSSLVTNLNTYSATWTPDGQKIVFSAWPLDTPMRDLSMFLINKDGTNIERLAPDDLIESRSHISQVSPDGKQIALVANRDFGGQLNGLFEDIFIMDIDGKKSHRLTDSLSLESTPVWAPDGQSMIFTSNRPFTGYDAMVFNIFRYDFRDQSITQLTQADNLFLDDLQWSPDGQDIAFTHRRADLIQPQSLGITIMRKEEKTGNEIDCQADYSCFCPQWIPSQ